MTSPTRAPATFHLIDNDTTKWAIRQGATYRIGFRMLDTDGNLLDTDGETFRMKVRDGDWDGDVVIDANTDNSRLVAGYNPGPVARNTAYGLGHQVIPASGPNGFVYECTTAGTSHASNEPTWPLMIAGTVSDGTVVWTCVATDAQVVNLYLELSATYTAALTDWGRGVWDLESVVGSDVIRLFEGVARLSREATY